MPAVEITAMKLVLGAAELELVPSADYRVRSVSLSLPEVRAAEFGLAGRDGVVDETARHGAANMAVDVRVVGSVTSPVAALVDELLAFVHPSKRPVLVWTPDGAAERQAVLSPRGGDKALTKDLPGMRDVLLQFRVPSGRSLAVAESSATADPNEDEPGFTFPLTFPLVFPAFAGRGIAECVNGGNTDTFAVAKLYGPWSGDTVFANLTRDEALYFDGLTVADGDWLELDFDARTVLLNGIAGATYYHKLDLSRSRWWALGPGASTVRFAPGSFDAGARADLTWFDAYL